MTSSVGLINFKTYTKHAWTGQCQNNYSKQILMSAISIYRGIYSTLSKREKMGCFALHILKQLKIINSMNAFNFKQQIKKTPVTQTFETRCRPSKGRQCIPDVDIEVHVETYLNADLSSSAQVKIQV